MKLAIEITLIALGVLGMGIFIHNLVRACRIYYGDGNRLKQVEAEIDFLKTRYDMVLSEWKSRIKSHDWDGCRNSLEKINQLDLRWKREVTNAIHVKKP